jgi:hypothetical protein
MTTEGNVRDTGIVAEAEQLIAENKDLNMSISQALDILKQQAKGDKEKMEKIKRTEKDLGVRHSRHSGKKKKTKR